MANIEKRVASRLMSYGKPVEVKGHLTERIIKTLLNFLGSCQISKVKIMFELKKAIGLVSCRYCDSSDHEIRHQKWPRNSDSWCEFL